MFAMLVALYARSQYRFGPENTRVPAEAVFTPCVRASLARAGEGLLASDTARSWEEALCNDACRVHAVALVRPAGIVGVADVLSPAQLCLRDYMLFTRWREDPLQLLDVLDVVALARPTHVHENSLRRFPRGIFLR